MIYCTVRIVDSGGGGGLNYGYKKCFIFVIITTHEETYLK